MAQSNGPSPDYGIHEKFPRPDKAPTEPEVANWPTKKEIGWPSLAESEDIAANKYMNNDVYKAALPHVESRSEWQRSANAPVKAEVAGWPFPQYAQQN